MITSDLDYHLLQAARAIYMEEKSFPQVYRFLVKHLDSEKAEYALYELKKSLDIKKAIA